MIFSVTTTLKKQNGEPVWWPFESPAQSVEEVADELAQNGFLEGVKLENREVRDGPRKGARLVTRRVPMLIGVNMVGTIQECHIDLITE